MRKMVRPLASDRAIDVPPSSLQHHENASIMVLVGLPQTPQAAKEANTIISTVKGSVIYSVHEPSMTMDFSDYPLVTRIPVNILLQNITPH